MTTKTAAHILQIHPSSVKRFCALGELGSDVTSGGHRRIHAHHLAAFIEKRQDPLFLLGLHSALEQYVDCLRIYFERHDSDELVELLFELAFEGKDDGFFAAVQHLMKLFPGQILVYGPILMSLLRHVERDYERQDLTIADEHRISQLIRDACILCYFDLPSPAKSNGQTAIVGCAQRDTHDISALITRIVFKSRGYEVRYLGADVPNEDFAREAKRWKADVVCISRTLPSGPGEDRNLIQSLFATAKDGLNYELILGGAWSEWAQSLAKNQDKAHPVSNLYQLVNLVASWDQEKV